MVAEMEQNFLLYTIIMEREDTAYIELRVKFLYEDGLKERGNPL